MLIVLCFKDITVLEDTKKENENSEEKEYQKELIVLELTICYHGVNL